ncbi:ElaB/YqjD/DUF883 family membrane-anchored ribosome-binding protein [Pararhizobium capsulatum DSM 1112]|uniref:ElaB/YqjD/DUF883 family membrane-anchored ribosome-binding protein n=1 Tax=Pararhizobium capsulatum DSM 1112 TaxID=1121113 RepID=A0ABU0BUJ0_9HYPH|nr:hypothetical protein [Pararhizobium capsulatum]MDQ0321369.1 ElaB/YqjD/DUF883 family membrane-anchored ribosome-binding protein [Pararhizobium capsulatum DSM 1112]
MATGLFSSSAKKRNGAFLNSVDDQLSEIRDDIATLSNLLSKRGAQASKDVRTKAGDIRGHAETGLDDLREQGELLLSELRDRYAVAERQVRQGVREHPVATIGAAAAVGVLLAIMLRR